MISEKEIKNFEKKIVLKDMPYSICIEPTNFCNLRCKMCGNAKMKRHKGYMEIGLFKKIIDELVEKCPDIDLWINGYGELLLHPAILEMLSYATESGMQQVSVNTNAMLLDENMADGIISSKINNIVFSIDGYHTDTYEKIRIGGKREQVYDNILKFMEKNHKLGSPVRVEVQMIEMEENQEERDEFVEFWSSKGAYIKLKSYISWGGNVDMRQDIVSSRYVCPICNNMQINWDGNVSYCSSADLDGKYFLCDSGGGY